MERRTDLHQLNICRAHILANEKNEDDKKNENVQLWLLDSVYHRYKDVEAMDQGDRKESGQRRGMSSGANPSSSLYFERRTDKEHVPEIRRKRKRYWTFWIYAV